MHRVLQGYLDNLDNVGNSDQLRETMTALASGVGLHSYAYLATPTDNSSVGIGLFIKVARVVLCMRSFKTIWITSTTPGKEIFFFDYLTLPDVSLEVL
jgi:hypothetical protein